MILFKHSLQHYHNLHSTLKSRTSFVLKSVFLRVALGSIYGNMDIGIGPSSPRGAGINMYGVRITCKDLYKYIIYYINITLHLVILSKSFSLCGFRY